MTFNECSPESWAEFFEIMNIIESFGCADDFLEPGLPPEEHEQSLSVLVVYRHALAIFTYDAIVVRYYSRRRERTVNRSLACPQCAGAYTELDEYASSQRPALADYRDRILPCQ